MKRGKAMKKKQILAGVLALLFSVAPISVQAAIVGNIKGHTPKAEANISKQAYIPVLMYHHFIPRGAGEGNNAVLFVDELEEQLQYFKEQGYTMISLEELDAILQKQEQLGRRGKRMGLPKKYLCITIDDGYYSNYELGFPLFEKYQTPVSIFAITDMVTNQTGLRKFTWEQANEMEQTDYVRIYSHTGNHKPLKEGEENVFLLSLKESEQALTEFLERKERVRAMSYPNGQYTPLSQQALKKDGYAMQFTIEEGVITNETKREGIPRITVVSGMDGKAVEKTIEKAAQKTFCKAKGA